MLEARDTQESGSETWVPCSVVSGGGRAEGSWQRWPWEWIIPSGGLAEMAGEGL